MKRHGRPQAGWQGALRHCGRPLLPHSTQRLAPFGADRPPPDGTNVQKMEPSGFTHGGCRKPPHSCVRAGAVSNASSNACCSMPVCYSATQAAASPVACQCSACSRRAALRSGLCELGTSTCNTWKPAPASSEGVVSVRGHALATKAP